MPRQPRRKSESGIYHIMLRGINKQTIFEDDEDYFRFLETLKKYKTVSEYKIFAYCLMPNHIHLLLKIEKEDLDLIMKRIAGSYVYWYNWKHKRIGHLFQDRYRSEPVENDEYFLTVVRYIHQNPVKSGICKNVSDYKYSSYNQYLEGCGIVDTDFCFDLIDKVEFIKFHNENNEDNCLDVEKNVFRLTDEEAKQLILSISNCKTLSEIQNFSTDKRDKLLKKLRNEGLSIRQISRLTGIGNYVIRKI